jgi:disulfide bond formation protein DsbB
MSTISASMMSASIIARLNALALYAIALALMTAFYFQLAFGELPCPLCMLQRLGLVALGVGPVLALRLGPRPSYYGLTLLAALIGAGIAARQVMLHIVPGDPGYGSTFLGYHFYTWAFLCFAATILAVAVLLLFDQIFTTPAVAPQLGMFEMGAIGLLIVLTVLNAASAVLECGFAGCPANPVRYELLELPG